MGFSLSSALEMQKISHTFIELTARRPFVSRSLIGALSLPIEGKLAKHTRVGGFFLWDKDRHRGALTLCIYRIQVVLIEVLPAQ